MNPISGIVPSDPYMVIRKQSTDHDRDDFHAEGRAFKIKSQFMHNLSNAICNPVNHGLLA
jgi:hypothetical protein